jgi:hypothetical protein
MIFAMFHPCLKIWFPISTLKNHSFLKIASGPAPATASAAEGDPISTPVSWAATCLARAADKVATTLNAAAAHAGYDAPA